MTNSSKPHRLNLDDPRWDQNTYAGRFKHFFVTINPLHSLHSRETLEKARDIVTRYKKGENIKNLSEDEIWRSQAHLRLRLPPRLGSTDALDRADVFTGSNEHDSRRRMVSFFTRPNLPSYFGSEPFLNRQLGISYVLGTGGAMAISTGFQQLITRSGKQFPLLSRLVPFLGVAAATCVNIPIMRSQELVQGVPVVDAQGNRVGFSAIAAQHGISQVVFSRIINAIPPMVLPPLVMNILESRLRLRLLLRYPKLGIPIQMGLVGIINIFATPMCCAIFPQKSSISASKLEHEIQAKLPSPSTILYYNKGL
ncbi:Sideroflexin-3 [Orchesella cincta]|uniref:Sideroflexin-3 n=1 Tax=Orchesella cincta TaxID=48709 RepID=A0A1D2MF30_ORCCI|nr:Sideroflexin-3 [Orchesella cincta]